MIIFILLFLLTKLQLILLNAQRIGIAKLLRTQFDSKSYIIVRQSHAILTYDQVIVRTATRST